MIPHRWYPILESSKLRRRPVGVRRLGRDFVLWRDADGRPVALPAACPHRGAALAAGRVIDGELACPWHGFRFAADGRCTRMPCEGEAAKPPAAMALAPTPLAEEHGLVWLWHTEEATRAAEHALPPVPFFPTFAGRDLRATAQASYILPYHYSRMVETNLDIHHTPFAHGSVLPGLGARVDPFEARIEGDHIQTEGVLRHEHKEKGFPFRVECLLPCLGALSLGERLHIVISATPVDETHSWVWFRYYQDYVRKSPALGRLISWASVQSELRIVQKQDWRIFAGLPGGTIDDVDYHLVRADQGIALYRRRRRELLDAAVGAH